MTRRTLTLSLALAGLLAVPAAGQAAPDKVTRVKVMAHSCLACHGADAQGPGYMPAINDLTEQGIVNKLMTFRENDNADVTVMDRHATGYTMDEIRSIARYIANLK
jgi:sulfide dehydrogenase cytochrome subunit